MRTDALRILDSECGDEYIADTPDLGDALHSSAERLRNGGPGVEKVHVYAAFAIVAGRVHLREVPVPARPPDTPGVHFPDTRRPVLAKKLREDRIAKAPAGLQRVGEVMLPMIG